jgi:hypothetical protein
MPLTSIRLDLEIVSPPLVPDPPSATRVTRSATMFVAQMLLDAVVMSRVRWWCSGAVVLGVNHDLVLA